MEVTVSRWLIVLSASITTGRIIVLPVTQILRIVTRRIKGRNAREIMCMDIQALIIAHVVSSNTSLQINFVTMELLTSVECIKMELVHVPSAMLTAS